MNSAGLVEVPQKLFVFNRNDDIHSSIKSSVKKKNMFGCRNHLNNIKYIFIGRSENFRCFSFETFTKRPMSVAKRYH